MSIRTSIESQAPVASREVALIMLVLVSTIATAGLAAATPATDIPIGTAESSGVSMLPTLGTSGVAIYADIPGAEPAEGDVVLFRDPGTDRYIMHRVVGSTSSGFVTQGDNLARTDQRGYGRAYVDESTYVGRALVVIDNRGIHFSP